MDTNVDDIKTVTYKVRFLGQWKNTQNIGYIHLDHDDSYGIISCKVFIFMQVIQTILNGSWAQ